MLHKYEFTWKKVKTLLGCEMAPLLYNHLLSNQKPRYIQHSAPNIQVFPNNVQMSGILEPMTFNELMA